MKVAIVHDYIKEYGGAERVLEVLHEMYPKAPVFTSVYLPTYLGPHQKDFATWDIRTSWAQNLPFKAKLISPLRLLSPLLFRSFDLSSYDVVIVSATGAYFPNTIKAKRKEQSAKSKDSATPSALSSLPRQICYCHTPPRYLYGYKTAREVTNPLLKAVVSVMNHFLRIIDFHASEHVDTYIANSEEVNGRIKKFYRRDAVVVYPPVLSDKHSINEKEKMKREYYLTGGRLARAKHNEIPIQACLELGMPLKVFGKGFAGYEEELKKLASNSQLIEFVGEVTDEEKWELLRGAKALLYASEDEDFGIIPVEAMASGTPVIAYRSGGVQETVIDGKTGIFFDELSVYEMKKAIGRFERMKLDEKDCIAQAQKFSEENFKKKIEQIVVKY